VRIVDVIQLLLHVWVFSWFNVTYSISRMVLTVEMSHFTLIYLLMIVIESVYSDFT